MKPVIYTDPDEPRLAHLVDEHSATVRIEKTTGKHLRHFDRAILIQDLKPGMFRFMIYFSLSLGEVVNMADDLEMEAVPPSPKIMEVWPGIPYAPRPCVYATITAWQPEDFKRAYADTDGPELCHGIHRQAAEVMLRLAASWNNVQPDTVTDSFAFGIPRIENTGLSLPWDKWAFLTAWLWSDWETRNRREKITLAKRFEEMQAAGYPNKFKAFAALHRRLFP